VAACRFSRRAEADLLEIGVYTLEVWGAPQTERYLGGLEAFCRRLADDPALGRPCDHVRPALHRMEHAKHVLFYRRERGGILIVRVLHQSMAPERHGFDDESDAT